MSVRNLLLKVRVGEYPAGEVVPAYVVADPVRREKLVELEMIEWTDREPTVTVAVKDLAGTTPVADPIEVLVRKEKEIELLLPSLKAQLQQMTAKATELEVANIRLTKQVETLTIDRDAATLRAAGANNALAQKAVEVESLRKDGVDLAECRIQRERFEKEFNAEIDLRAQLESESRASQAIIADLTAQVAAANEAVARTTLRLAALEKSTPAEPLIELTIADPLIATAAG